MWLTKIDRFTEIRTKHRQTLASFENSERSQTEALEVRAIYWSTGNACFDCPRRLHTLIVYINIWSAGQHQQVQQIGTSTCIEKGPFSSRFPNLVDTFHALRYWCFCGSADAMASASRPFWGVSTRSVVRGKRFDHHGQSPHIQQTRHCHPSFRLFTAWQESRKHKTYASHVLWFA